MRLVAIALALLALSPFALAAASWTRTGDQGWFEADVLLDGSDTEFRFTSSEDESFAFAMELRSLDGEPLGQFVGWTRIAEAEVVVEVDGREAEADGIMVEYDGGRMQYGGLSCSGTTQLGASQVDPTVWVRIPTHCLPPGTLRLVAGGATGDDWTMTVAASSVLPIHE